MRKARAYERETFEKCTELQKSLTSSSSGLAPCVAEMVATGDLDVLHSCSSCFHSYYHEFGHLPVMQTTPLHAAAINGLIHIVEMILKNGGDINLQCSESGTPLHAAARAGQKRIVRLLLDRAYRCHEDTVRLLLDNGANVNAQAGDYGTALQAALDSGKREIVQLLLDRGALPVYGDGETGRNCS
ncbi:ankyrin [Aspergillus pseudoustus]|uniref:Ankyrin n=1 Tax=Aspergillus pseudoustus TaxID=1810923 RepID=A0ABR4IEJ3_9EURO